MWNVTSKLLCLPICILAVNLNLGYYFQDNDDVCRFKNSGPLPYLMTEKMSSQNLKAKSFKDSATASGGVWRNPAFTFLV